MGAVMLQESLTWTQLLNIANTVLVLVVGFLLREEWKAIHQRIDALSVQQGVMRERLSSLEAFRRWGNPTRRETDWEHPPEAS